MLVLVDVRVLVDVLVLVLVNVVVVGGVITNSTFVSHSATLLQQCVSVTIPSILHQLLLG